MDVSEVKERWSRVQNNKNWMNRPNEELFTDFVRCYILLKWWWKCRQMSASRVFVFWLLLVPLSAPCAEEHGDDASWTVRWRLGRTCAASTPCPALSGFRHGVLSADLLQTYSEYKFIQNSSTSLGAGQLLPVVLHRAWKHEGSTNHALCSLLNLTEVGLCPCSQVCAGGWPGSAQISRSRGWMHSNSQWLKV